MNPRFILVRDAIQRLKASRGLEIANGRVSFFSSTIAGEVMRDPSFKHSASLATVEGWVKKAARNSHATGVFSRKVNGERTFYT